MKIFILLLLVTVTCSLKAQEEIKQDTIRLDNPEQKDTHTLVEFEGEFNNPVFHQPLVDIKSRILLDNIELRMSYAESFNFNFMDGELPDPSDILSPWYDQYLKSQKFSWIKLVLGTAQTAAVGYLAYKHIEKYGFLKSKK